ncbi:MAG: hypothetical protein AAGK14_10885 [Verrucomicrobiota bacterium]
MAALVATSESYGQARIDKITAEGKTFVQEASGTQFPTEIGNFVRSDLFSYGDDPNDVSAGYDPKAKEWFHLTVYSFLAKKYLPASDEPYTAEEIAVYSFEDAVKAIKQYTPDAREISNGPYTIEVGGKEIKGWRAEFEIPGGRGGIKGPAGSQLYIFQQGAWQIKCRATYALDVPKVDEGIREVLQGIGWPTTTKAPATEP